ncbi:uncharacterized protein LOC129590535 [Paramacrobiotus metropolitanus]|uniref:uncharacterized protein LOC129590535 n=1 Tax=Paramacrobiotus metropolitanus TaxID=2943436 RepID=UPI002445C0A1|nr:uncharacterized protein LOC129590535 [Paramacrobiotus metropolitanus]
MLDTNISPYKYPHDYGVPKNQLGASITAWRTHNTALIKDGTSQRQRSDRLVEDSLRLCRDRFEVNRLAETQVKQKLEQRVDAVGYFEDELEGMLHDLRQEDDKLQLCHSRLCESISKNLRPLWDLAQQCLHMRAARPAGEATEDEVNNLLRDEQKLSERTSRYFDHLISNLENQHRLNNAVTYRCQTLKQLDKETREAAKFCDKLSRTDGIHSHQQKNLLVQMHPVKMNFAEWSALCKDAFQSGMSEINKSNAMRLTCDDALAVANGNIEKLYGEIEQAFQRRITDVRKAKAKLEDEVKKVQENLQKIRAAKDDLDTLRKTTITPERVTQFELTKRVLPTPLHRKTDPVHRVLGQEIAEYRHGNQKANEHLEQCDMQMVALRGMINRLNDDIKKKDEAIRIDEVHCRELRNVTKLQRVDPSRCTGNPMKGDVVKWVGRNGQPV